MTDGKPLPPWASYLLRYGGTAAAVLVVWFTVALPMREDFRGFTATVDKKLGSIEGKVEGVSNEVRNLTENVVVMFRERLARLEERQSVADKEIAALRAKADGK